MKTSTIWESASRPLFVRTVWLENSELRPGLQRHFLLDYDTKRPLERLKSAINSGQYKRKGESNPIYNLRQEALHLSYPKQKHSATPFPMIYPSRRSFTPVRMKPFS